LYSFIAVMNKKEIIFLQSSEISFDRRHRKILNFNISKYEQTVSIGKEKFIHFEKARRFASAVKKESTEGIPEYLELFEKNIESRGAKVLWAKDGNKALLFIQKILTENHSGLIVKSKSMITEEIGLNEFTKKMKIETIETDLGEFIVQTAGEKPYHIITPAMHKSKEDVAALFSKEFHIPEHSQPHEIAAFVRAHLRKLFSEADVGVTGANFIVADIGGIGLTENEGNGLMTFSFPKIHIVIAGIERIIPSVKQLPFFFQWIGVHGTGQNISAYNSLLLGPRCSCEIDGPEKMFVILLDNGRSNILEDDEITQALTCIRCGSCLNACPIYRNIGGYTYASTYTGPIGSVITPFLKGFNDFGHLSFACTLCRKCTEICPVEIPVHELILLNRKRMAEKYHSSGLWKKGMKIYSYTFRKRRRIDLFQGKYKNVFTHIVPQPFGKYKKTPEFASGSFSKQWKLLNI
jgi:L-lactate dehydrogenase complex protein LldF